MTAATNVRDSIIVPGFANLQSLTKHLVARLTSNGLFTQVFPSGNFDGEGIVILEPTNVVDTVRGATNTVPTWRLALSVDKLAQTLTLNAATPMQLQDDGAIAKATWLNEPKNPGQINNFVDRRHIKDPAASAVYPMTYALTVTDHGVFLAIWDQAFDERQDEILYLSPALRWILIQRPVDNKTGIPVTSGKAPVYCVFTKLDMGTVPATQPFKGMDTNGNVLTFVPGVKAEDCISPMPQYARDVASMLQNPILWSGDPTTAYVTLSGYQVADSVQVHSRFVVCESDVHRPSLAIPADAASEDAGPILNANRQVATSEDNKYVITIPKGLNTTRYAYTHELDMISYTSADVIGEGTVIDLPLYEGDYRFQALAANRQRNTGMRILFRINNEDDTVPAPASGPMETMPAGTIGIE